MHRSHTDSLTLAHDLAKPTYGLVSRNLLRTHGIDRHKLRRLSADGGLVPQGNHAVRVAAAQWDPSRSPVMAAVINSGAAAWADGLAALIVAGLTGYEPGVIDVGVPENAAARQVDGIRRHRLRHAPPLRTSPILHAEPVHAALRAASWAESDHEATSLITACVAQHLVTVAQLRQTVGRLTSLHRRTLVLDVLDDLDGRCPELHGIDFARLCRQHETPPPDRVDFGRGIRRSPILEARWNRARVTVRLESEPYPLREEDYSDIADAPTIAGIGDRVLHASRATLWRDTGAFFEWLDGLLTERTGRS